MHKTAAEVVEFIKALRITQGAGEGDPWLLLPWQKRFITGAMRPGVAESSLSVGRGNGKSTLIAGIAAAALVGPIAQPRAEIVVTAASFAQAGIIFAALRSFLEQDHDLGDRKTWAVLDNSQVARITHKPSRISVRCIGADAGRAAGLQPSLLLLDEPASWQGVRGERLYITLMTALGKIPNARLIALGTRPAGGDHWFARLLDGGADYCQVHAAGDDDPPFHRRTWKRANPSLDAMPDLETAIRREATKIRRDETLLPSFKALRLNQGTSDVQSTTILDLATWLRIEGEAEATGPFALGVDTGQTEAMSALAAYWPETGRLEALGCFPANPGLRDREIHDGAGYNTYRRMASRGELIVAGEYVSDLSALLVEAARRWGYPRDTLNNPSAQLNSLCVELQSTDLFRPSLVRLRLTAGAWVSSWKHSMRRPIPASRSVHVAKDTKTAPRTYGLSGGRRWTAT